ncbi:uncharacterized protein LOC113970029 [Neopelma chrysocephalum]|uniref:uncharacterized protein LOC113970029 n=1 Tax=Neopelma chrysocephalum TaxID=114329 RepID=UPI000FCD0D18|nr:uncharacterized protein LOC113970029 [Neopelma chrysocephalum]
MRDVLLCICTGCSELVSLHGSGYRVSDTALCAPSTLTGAERRQPGSAQRAGPRGRRGAAGRSPHLRGGRVSERGGLGTAALPRSPSRRRRRLTPGASPSCRAPPLPPADILSARRPLWRRLRQGNRRPPTLRPTLRPAVSGPRRQPRERGPEQGPAGSRRGAGLPRARGEWFLMDGDPLCDNSPTVLHPHGLPGLVAACHTSVLGKRDASLRQCDTECFILPCRGGCLPRTICAAQITLLRVKRSPREHFPHHIDALRPEHSSNFLEGRERRAEFWNELSTSVQTFITKADETVAEVVRNCSFG